MSMSFIGVGGVVRKILDLRVFVLPVYGVTWMTSFSHTGSLRRMSGARCSCCRCSTISSRTVRWAYPTVDSSWRRRDSTRSSKAASTAPRALRRPATCACTSGTEPPGCSGATTLTARLQAIIPATRSAYPRTERLSPSAPWATTAREVWPDTPASSVSQA